MTILSPLRPMLWTVSRRVLLMEKMSSNMIVNRKLYWIPHVEVNIRIMWFRRNGFVTTQS